MKKLLLIFILGFLSLNCLAIVKTEIPLRVFVAKDGINISEVHLPEPEEGSSPYLSYAVGYHKEAVSKTWLLSKEDIVKIDESEDGVLTVTPLKEGTVTLRLKMLDAQGKVIRTGNDEVIITVGVPEDAHYSRIAYIGNGLSFYDGAPHPVVMPTQGNLEKISITADPAIDNRQSNDMEVNVYKGNFSLKNNIIPSIKGPGIDGMNLGISYSYYSNGNEAPIGWHTNFESKIKIHSFPNNTAQYFITLPDGRVYRFRSIPVRMAPDLFIPVGKHVDVDYSKFKVTDNGYVLTLRNGSKYIYNHEGVLKEQVDRLGNALVYNYDNNSLSSNFGKLVKIEEFLSLGGTGRRSTGRNLSFNYSKKTVGLTVEKITEITDPEGRKAKVIEKLNTEGDGEMVFEYPDGTEATYLMKEWRIEKITTPRGDEINITYTLDPHAETFDLPNEKPGKYYYVSTISDASGVSTYERHPNGSGKNALRRIKHSTVTDMKGQKCEYYFNIKGQVTKREFKDSSGVKVAEESFAWKSYTGNGSLLEKYTDMNGVETKYTFKAGNPVSSETGSGVSKITKGFEFNDDFDVMTKMTDPLGRNWKNNVSGKTGLITKTIKPDRAAINYIYNSGKQLVRETNERGHSTSYSYNSWGLLSEIVDPEENRVTFTYDKAGNLIKKKDANGNETEYEYDKLNRNTKIIKPYGTIIMKYDANGNMTEKKDQEGKITKWLYNHRNQVLEEEDHLGQKLVYEYDEVGNKISVTDKKGFKTEYTYDALNRLVEEKDEYDNTSTYTYGDNSGNPIQLGGKALPTKITDKNGNSITIEYDSLYRKIKETDGEGNSTEYSYDKNSNLVEQKDALNRVTQFKYDQVNQKVEMIDPLSHKEEYEYDQRGNLTKVINKNRYSTFTFYDRANRPNRVRNHLGYETLTEYDGVGNKTKVTDPMGNNTYFKYDDENRLVEVETLLGGKRKNTYNKVGQKTSETDEKGNTTEYRFDDLHRVTDTIGAEGFTLEHLEYDANNNVVLRRNAEGKTTTYEYDKLNRLTRERNPLGDSKYFEYDKLNNILEQEDERGKKTEYTYNKVYKVLKTIDANGKNVENTYDKVYNITKVKDKRGKETETKYDKLNRPIEVTRPDSTYSKTVYDPVGNIIEVRDFNGNTTESVFDAINRKVQDIDPLGKSTRYYYNKNNQLAIRFDKRGNDFEIQYDGLGRKIEETDPYEGKVIYSYEVNGNLKTVTDANGLKTTFEYDKLNRKTKETDYRNQVKTFEYNKLGSLVKSIDRNGVVTEREYDALNRLVKVKEDTLGINKITQYQYDKVGNRTKLIDSNNRVTEYTYDDVNRVRRHTFPDTNYYEFSYDNNGNITNKRTPNGVNIGQSFDDLNRLTSKDLGSFGTWTYSYDGNSNLKTAVNPNASLSYTYDELNRLKQEDVAYTSTGDTNTMSYTYDEDSNLDTATTFAGKTIDYTVDKLGRVTDLTAHNGTTLELSYDAGSRPLTRTLSNGVTTNYAWDSLNRLLEAKSSVISFQQNFDKENNKLFLRRSFGTVSQADHYDYDTLYRVVGTKYGVTSQNTNGPISETNPPLAPAYDDVTGTKTQESALDKEHNRISHMTDGASIAYQVNAMNQYTSVDGVTYSYDNNGNLTQDGNYKYEFDPENRLVAVKQLNDDLVASYQYGPNGKRIAKVLGNGTTFTYYYDKDWNLSNEYLNNQLVKEFTFTGIDQIVTSSVNLNVLGIDPVVLGMDSETEVVELSYHQSPIQNVLALTDTAGQVLCRYAYDSHGEVSYLDANGDAISAAELEVYKHLNEFLFQGRQIDLECEGQYYFRNRMYNYKLGRFTSTDPLDYIDGMNIYAAMNGNIVNLVDPMGTRAIEAELRKYKSGKMKPGQIVDLMGKMKKNPLKYADPLTDNELGFAEKQGVQLFNSDNFSAEQMQKAKEMFPGYGNKMAGRAYQNYLNKRSLLRDSIKGDVANYMTEFYRMARDMNPVHFALERGAQIGSGKEMFTGEDVSRTGAGIELGASLLLIKGGQQIGKYASTQKTVALQPLKTDSTLMSPLSNQGVSSERYNLLRRRSPTGQIRKSLNTQEVKVDPVYGYEVKTLEADHIYSMKRATEKPGFNRLNLRNQIDVLNTKENFVGLGKSSNASKGAKSWAEWAGHKRLGAVPPEVRKQMLSKEVAAENIIFNKILELLKEQQ